MKHYTHETHLTSYLWELKEKSDEILISCGVSFYILRYCNVSKRYLVCSYEKL